MSKPKRMTQREKKLRVEVRQELREKGILPPVKPKLNRKKFAAQVIGEFNELLRTDAIRAELCLIKAIGCMVGKDMKEVSPEQVGVLKLLKIAVDTNTYMKALEDEGIETYTLGDYIDKVVSPVWKL
jgi:hypothetical protein